MAPPFLVPFAQASAAKQQQAIAHASELLHQWFPVLSSAQLTVVWQLQPLEPLHLIDEAWQFDEASLQQLVTAVRHYYRVVPLLWDENRTGKARWLSPYWLLPLPQAHSASQPARAEPSFAARILSDLLKTLVTDYPAVDPTARNNAVDPTACNNSEDLLFQQMAVVQALAVHLAWQHLQQWADQHQTFPLAAIARQLGFPQSRLRIVLTDDPLTSQWAVFFTTPLLQQLRGYFQAYGYQPPLTPLC